MALVFGMCHIRARPLAPGTRQAGCWRQPLTGFTHVLLLTTWARPPRLMCGATGYHYDPYRVTAGGLPGSAAAGRLRVRWALMQEAHRLRPFQPVTAGAEAAALAGHGGFTRVALRDGNVPVVLDMRLSRCKAERDFLLCAGKIQQDTLDDFPFFFRKGFHDLNQCGTLLHRQMLI